MDLILYDATLREGAQSAGNSFSVQDKLRIVSMLDELGIPYIEAGNPGANQKDAQLYQELKNKPLRSAKLAAFGATCRAGVRAADDANLQALMRAETPVVAIFGKCWDFQVRTVLRCSLEENLDIIAQSVHFCKEQGREVVFDAEHFFDGCKANLNYALDCIRAAAGAGADWICLCDTNGGTMVNEIGAFVEKARAAVNMPLGIHTHNDTGQAVASSIAAVNQGAVMVQCTLCGWGERCGNADLFTVLGNLQLKLEYQCLPAENLRQLVGMSHELYELVNRSADKSAPYVGKNAFAHKAGMHIDAVKKAPSTFEHIDPELVGAQRRILLSEVSGKSAILEKVRIVIPELDKDSPQLQQVLDELKAREMAGYQFEGAEASFELMVRRMLTPYETFFDVREYKVVSTYPAEADHAATAMVRVYVREEEEITAADGNGPVHALDSALRKALERFYPSLRDMYLSDFKVRVLDSRHTASHVRVLIESSDGNSNWTTVGVHGDILQASFTALLDSIEYKLLRDSMG